MKRLFVILMCLFSLSIAHAQSDSPQYRLRVPSADEYLTTIPPFIEQYVVEIGDNFHQRVFLPIPELEAQYRYPNLYQQDYQQIADAFHALSIEIPQALDWQFWNNALVLSWIIANDIDLNTATELAFDEFVVQITPQDFDADGSDEFVLFIAGSFSYNGYLVLKADNHSYSIIPHPLPFGVGGQFRYDFAINAWLETLDFRDLNGDGNLEWLVKISGTDDGSTSASQGRLSILEWHDGVFVDIGDENLSFLQASGAEINWSFANTDEDNALEIEQHRNLLDNWGCSWQEISIFDWDGSLFTRTTTRQDFPQTTGCLIRQAEAAMWDGQLEDAVVLYEMLPRTVELVDILASSEDTLTASASIALSNFTDTRLALAYMLLGREDEGLAVLHSLQTLSESDQRLDEYVQLLLDTYAVNPTAVGVCIAAYDFILFHGYYFDAEALLVVGFTLDNEIYDTQGMYIPPPASPISAACDAPTFVNQIVANHTFTTQTLPADQLEALGIPVASTFETDLDSDGQSEWLVWTTSLIAPFFFAPDGEHYVMSRSGPIGESLGIDNEVTTWELPDGLGSALVNLDFVERYQQRHLGYGIGGGPGCPNPIERAEDVIFDSNPGTLTLWRLVNHELVPLISVSMCERATIDEIFSEDARALNAWVFDDFEAYLPVIYTWDAGQQTYVAPPASPTPTYPPPNNVVRTPNVYGLAVNALQKFADGDYEAIIEDSIVVLQQSATDAEIMPLLYLAALSYEALNCPDEALAAYIAIYTAAPDSSWGQLAALHLEPID